MNTTRQEPTENEPNDRVAGLIRSAQDGDEAAFEKLFRSYRPMIARLVDRYAVEGAPEAELWSDAIDAFTAAVSHFDPEQAGVTFGLYAQICIGNRLISAWRSFRRVSSPVSLDEIDPDSLRAGEESDPAHSVLEAERYADLCRKMEAILSPAERRVWMLFISGLTAGQIAERLGTDRKSVENALFRSRRKLRESFREH